MGDSQPMCRYTHRVVWWQRSPLLVQVFLPFLGKWEIWSYGRQRDLNLVRAIVAVCPSRPRMRPSLLIDFARIWDAANNTCLIWFASGKWFVGTRFGISASRPASMEVEAPHRGACNFFDCCLIMNLVVVVLSICVLRVLVSHGWFPAPWNWLINPYHTHPVNQRQLLMTYRKPSNQWKQQKSSAIVARSVWLDMLESLMRDLDKSLPSPIY